MTLGLHFTYIPPALLTCAGAALPGLRSLIIVTSVSAEDSLQFPAPEHLPALRELTVFMAHPQSKMQAAVWRSMAPYISQLTSLTVGEQAEDEDKFAVLYDFGGCSGGHRLRDLGPMLRCVFGTKTTTLKRLFLPIRLCPNSCKVIARKMPVRATARASTALTAWPASKQQC